MTILKTCTKAVVTFLKTVRKRALVGIGIFVVVHPPHKGQRLTKNAEPMEMESTASLFLMSNGLLLKSS